MNCRVFVSCGQHGREEREIARGVCHLLESRGFSTYLAIDVQTILDINGRIIRELKNSDCYLLVNRRRERIGEADEQDPFRGSLFSNQELAIAYSLAFERILIVNQEGIKPEGLLRYIGVNTETFRNHHDCLEVVKRALDASGWTPEYSRRLRADNLHFYDELIRYGQLNGWFLYLDIHNDRPDIAALQATARLSGYKQAGEQFRPSIIRSPLKATARREAFSHTFFPKSHEAFDILCIAPDPASTAQLPMTYLSTPRVSGTYSGPTGPGAKVYLNCALDVSPLPCLPLTPGKWMLRYEFFAIDFPVLRVDVEIEVPQTFTGNRPPHVRLVSQEIA